MEFFRQSWATIQTQVSEWSFTTKWLIVSLVVILLLVGGLFISIASSPQMVPISPVAEGGAVQLVAHLESDGIKSEVRGGQVYVPVKQQERALATLAVNNLISPDAYSAFTEMVKNQSWMTTNRQSDQQMRMATGRFLSTVVGEFPGVDHAYVVIDKPDTVGIGLGYVPPSAMVTVNMKPGSSVDRGMADALIALVQGAVSELPAENVKVIDASNRREFSAQDESGVDAGTQLEHLIAQERLHKQKIEEVLRSFAGSTVAVKIVTSQVVRESIESQEYQEKTAPLSERNNETTTTNTSRSGEPGARAMTGTSIDGGATTGTESSSIESNITFADPQRTTRSVRDVAGSEIRLIKVSIAVPRSYFVQVFQAQNAGSMGDTPPTDDDLKPIIEGETQKIKDLVENQIVTLPSESEAVDAEAMANSVQVHMVYDQAYLEPVAAGATGGLGAVMSSDWAPLAMVGTLAIISLALMLGLVKKATRTEDMPTIEELAGVPPTLPGDDDLMGEVDEMDGGLAGVELEEGELRSRQIAEQISEMVKANPEEAGGLLGKWVGTEKL